MIEKWKTLRKVTVTKSPIFTVNVLERQPPWGDAPANFYVVDLPDWVNVVALTEDDEVVMVRQYRHGTDSVTLEIPGGNVDEGESFLEAAKRELAEETGYVAQAWKQIGMVEPNPAIQSNRCATFLGLGARLELAPEPDEHEDLAVELVERADLRGLVESGQVTHALVVNAFYFLERLK